VPYLLALGSAVLYGAADFVGGLTSRRAETIAVVLVAQFAGLLSLSLLVPLLPAVAPTFHDLLWGAAAGLCGSIGVALLYRGLAIGTMAIVAPTTAVCAVTLPVAYGYTRGEALSTLAAGGILLALVSIVLVAQESRREPMPPKELLREPRPTVAAAATHDVDGETDPLPPAPPADSRIPPGLGLAFVSGIAIGGFYVALSQAQPEAGLWPLLVARGASVTLLGAIAILGSRSLRMPASATAMAIGAGVVDMIANGLYLAATWSGMLSVIVTLSSLYPASTVLLARLFLGERLNTIQTIGVVCALIAVVLIVQG
jgi:drug/metabolite transporter (DMT)-like permease